MLALVAGRPERVPVIVSERADPSYNPTPVVWDRLRRFTYPWASAIVVQTPEVGRWASAFMRTEAVNIIPNFAVAPSDGMRTNGDISAARTATAGPAVRQVIAMGRLDDQKGFDSLIRAFAICRTVRPEWQLTILGEGEKRSEFEALARQLDVTSDVRFRATSVTERFNVHRIMATWETLLNDVATRSRASA